MCFENLYFTWPNHSCLRTLQMKRGGAPLFHGDKGRVITQEVFKMFIVLLYVKVKETVHLMSRYKAQNTIRNVHTEISKGTSDVL